MKNSFILMREHKEIFDSLTNEQAGVLINAIFQYATDKTEPKLDGVLKIAFIPIRQYLDRSDQAYEEKCLKNSQNGAKGGRGNKANALSEKRKKRTVISESEKSLPDPYPDPYPDPQHDSELHKDSKDMSDSNFDDFYSCYPRHEGKGQAEKAYRAALKIVSGDKILESCKALAEHHAALGTDKQYIKLPATWLNGKCWEDELIQPQTARGKPNKPTFFEMLDNIVGDESEAIDI